MWAWQSELQLHGQFLETVAVNEQLLYAVVEIHPYIHKAEEIISMTGRDQSNLVSALKNGKRNPFLVVGEKLISTLQSKVQGFHKTVEGDDDE